MSVSYPFFCITLCFTFYIATKLRTSWTISMTNNRCIVCKMCNTIFLNELARVIATCCTTTTCIAFSPIPCHRGDNVRIIYIERIVNVAFSSSKSIYAIGIICHITIRRLCEFDMQMNTTCSTCITHVP